MLILIIFLFVGETLTWEYVWLSWNRSSFYKYSFICCNYNTNLNSVFVCNNNNIITTANVVPEIGLLLVISRYIICRILLFFVLQKLLFFLNLTITCLYLIYKHTHVIWIFTKLYLYALATFGMLLSACWVILC